MRGMNAARRLTTLCACALAVLLLCAGIAEEVRAAGFRMLSADELTIGVWYPSDAAEEEGRLGPFDVQLAFDAPVREEGKVQFILLSHGYLGRMRNHFTTAKALADAGFVVVAPLHAADHMMAGDDITNVLYWRVTELKSALEAVLQIDAFRRVADLSRIHALGYSLGAVTALNAAGAGVDLQVADAHCARNDDPAFCDEPNFILRWRIKFTRDTVTPDFRQTIPARYFTLPVVSGGVAVVAPVGQGVVFDENTFTAQKVFIVGLESDEVTLPQWHAQYLHEILPEDKVAHFSIRSGNHHAFIAPFAARVTEVEDIVLMRDPPGFDRPAFLRELNSELVAFFVQQAQPVH